MDRKTMELLLTLAAEQGKETFAEVAQQLINAAALENGYADKHGLPYPRRRGRR